MIRYSVHKVELSPDRENFKIVDDLTDSRVATCYLEGNAEMVCNALNQVKLGDEFRIVRGMGLMNGNMFWNNAWVLVQSDDKHKAGYLPHIQKKYPDMEYLIKII